MFEGMACCFLGTKKQKADVRNKDKVSKQSFINRCECTMYVLQAIQKHVNMSSPSLGLNKDIPSFITASGHLEMKTHVCLPKAGKRMTGQLPCKQQGKMRFRSK